MSAPDRSREVKQAFEGLTRAPKTDDDERRRANLFAVVRYLNLFDPGEWGVLVKTDQGDKIPGDILVWRSTMEHFDIITAAGDPHWLVLGPVTKPAWHWRAVPAGAPAPIPTPTPTPGPPAPAPAPDLSDDFARLFDDVERLLGGMSAIVESNARLEAKLEEVRTQGVKVRFL